MVPRYWSRQEVQGGWRRRVEGGKISLSTIDVLGRRAVMADHVLFMKVSTKWRCGTNNSFTFLPAPSWPWPWLLNAAVRLGKLWWRNLAQNPINDNIAFPGYHVIPPIQGTEIKDFPPQTSGKCCVHGKVAQGVGNLSVWDIIFEGQSHSIGSSLY